MKYYQLIRDMSKFNLRLQMVMRAKTTSVSETARFYGATRPTVRKWLGRFEKEGLSGLKDRPKIPKYIPHKMKPEDEERIVSLRKEHPGWGSMRLLDLYHVAGSNGSVHRVIRQNGLIKPKRKRWRKRKDLSELKKKLGLFASNQIDTKDLCDIYHYWPLMRRLGLPRYEYTFRERSLGATFFAYADENNSLYGALFAWYVIEHLKTYGIDIEGDEWQTDNGYEFIGSVRKKINRLSAFEGVLKENHITHIRIPPRCSYLQSDVETFHRIVEDEFYDIEDYANGVDFLGKAYAYQLFFNYLRKNRYREHKAPVEILRERFPNINEGVLNLPPIRLESLLEAWYKRKELQGGYDVPISARKEKNCS